MTFLFLPTHLQFEAPEHPMVNKQRLNMFDRAALCREGDLQTALRFNQLHIYRNAGKKHRKRKYVVCRSCPVFVIIPLQIFSLTRSEWGIFFSGWLGGSPSTSAASQTLRPTTPRSDSFNPLFFLTLSLNFSRLTMSTGLNAVRCRRVIGWLRRSWTGAPPVNVSVGARWAFLFWACLWMSPL